MASKTERENRMRWDMRRRGHHEAWYATFNHRPTQTGFWIRHTLDIPRRSGEPTCGTWFALFDAKVPGNKVAYHRKDPIDHLSHRDDPFSLEVGPCRLDNRSWCGSLGTTPVIYLDQTREPNVAPIDPVRWDLRFPESAFAHRHLPAIVARRGVFPRTTTLPNPMTFFSGAIDVGDRRFELDDEPGCQGHLWGRGHPYGWAWGHCNAFREDSTANLEVLTQKLRHGPFSSPSLTVASLYLGREVYHFREPWTAAWTRSSWKPGRLRFRATGLKIRIEGELTCRPTDMVRCDFDDASSGTITCHNSEIADATVNIYQRRSPTGPFRRHTKLTSRSMAHLESGGCFANAAVDFNHLRIGARPTDARRG